MGEQFGSGDCWQRVAGARRQCGNKHHSRFRVQGFGDHGGDVDFERDLDPVCWAPSNATSLARDENTQRTKVPNCGRPRQVIVKKGLTVPASSASINVNDTR